MISLYDLEIHFKKINKGSLPSSHLQFGWKDNCLSKNLLKVTAKETPMWTQIIKNPARTSFKNSEENKAEVGHLCHIVPLLLLFPDPRPRPAVFPVSNMPTQLQALEPEQPPWCACIISHLANLIHSLTHSKLDFQLVIRGSLFHLERTGWTVHFQGDFLSR